jgi:hypothetical protein
MLEADLTMHNSPREACEIQLPLQANKGYIVLYQFL